MESENRRNGDGGIESGVREREVANMRVGHDVVLRFSAMVFSLAAAVVLGVDTETTTVLVTLAPTLPPVTVQVTSKWHYMSTFVFVVVANAISCSYAATSLLLTLAYGGAPLLRRRSHFRRQPYWSKRELALSMGQVRISSAIRPSPPCASGAATSAFFLLAVLAIINLH